MKKLMKHFCFLSILFVFTLCNYDNCFVKAAETQLSSQYEVLGADIWSDVGSSCTQGSKVTLAAKGKGGSGSYTYKFLIQDAAGNWGMLQNYSTNNKIVWNASVAGKKTLYVDIKDSTGKVVRKSKEVNVISANPLSIKYFGIEPNKVVVGERINLSAKAEGGSGIYTYKFLMQDVKTGGWYMIQDYSSKFTATWIPGSEGERKLFVDVKDSTGKVVRKEIQIKCNKSLGEEWELPIM